MGILTCSYCLKLSKHWYAALQRDWSNPRTECVTIVGRCKEHLPVHNNENSFNLLDGLGIGVFIEVSQDEADLLITKSRASQKIKKATKARLMGMKRALALVEK